MRKIKSYIIEDWLFGVDMFMEVVKRKVSELIWPFSKRKKRLEKKLYKQQITPLNRVKWNKTVTEFRGKASGYDYAGYSYPSNDIGTFIINGDNRVDKVTSEKSYRNNTMLSLLESGRLSNVDDCQYDKEGEDGFICEGEDGSLYELTAGYYWAVCLGVIEMPDNQTLVLVFDPYDKYGRRREEICLSIPRRIRASESLGELLYAMGGEYKFAHYNSSLAIEDVDGFREMFQDTEVGIEVSVNFDNGLMYITDFFNVRKGNEYERGEDLPTCPEEIVRHKF